MAKESTHKVCWSSKAKKFVTRSIDSIGTSLFDGTKAECDNKVELLNSVANIPKKKKTDD